jgi:predicted GNAT family N-acyltransferase
MSDESWIAVVEVIYGTDLYAQTLALREAVLRRPLGLRVTAEEREDDLNRQHFGALSSGQVVGAVSLKPLSEAIVQLKQMAVAEERQRRGIGRALLVHAESWAQASGFHVMVLHAREGAEAFYARYAYVAEGEPFEENTIPHIRMTKRLA